MTESQPNVDSSNVVARAFRFRRGDDLRKTFETTAVECGIDAGCIGSSVGSLSKAKMRLAGQQEPLAIDGPLEVLSLSGTVGIGGVHLHMMVADSQGTCVGGHVVEGCIIYTTLEVVILQLAGHKFARLNDSTTGFMELLVQSQKSEDG